MYFKSFLFSFVFCVSSLFAQRIDLAKPFYNFSSNEILNFESNPTAAFTIYLNADSLLPSESMRLKSSLVATYFVVSEDFRPFNVNVTFKSARYHSSPKDKRINVILSSKNTANANDSSLFCFAQPGLNVTKSIAAKFGLTPDTKLENNASKYCASIMAVSASSFKLFTNYEIKLLASKLGCSTDDVGNDFEHSKALTIAGDSLHAEGNNGVVGQEGDVDVYAFEFNKKGNVNLRVRPLYFFNNLHVRCDVYNENGEVVLEGIPYRHYDLYNCDSIKYFNENIGDYAKGWLEIGKQGVKLIGELPAGKYFIKISSADFYEGEKLTYDANSALGYYEIDGDLGFLAPKANFACPQQICKSTKVIFANTSRGSECSYKWTFTGANISSSTLEEPEVKYDKFGEYTVKLEVTNVLGTSVFIDTIVVHDIPLKFTIGKEMLNKEINIQFKDPSYLMLADFYRDDLQPVDSNTFYVNVCLDNDCYNMTVKEPFAYRAVDCGLVEWSRTQSYYFTDTVAYKGGIYASRYYSYKLPPNEGVFQYGPWAFLGNCVAKDTLSGFKLLSPVDNREFVSVSPKELSAMSNSSEYATNSLCIEYPADTAKKEDIIISTLVYPNPTQQNISLATEYAQNENYLEVYSCTGELMLQQKINSVNGIDVSRCSVGINIIKILSKDGEVLSIGKFVKY